MRNSKRYPFATKDSSLGEVGYRPQMPITFIYQGQSVAALGLLDTGAAINVLPYQIGIELGAVWEEATVPLQLTGNLARYEARVLVVSAAIAEFEPVELVFAWTQATEAPLILGQVNFFMEFDVCFYRSQLFL